MILQVDDLGMCHDANRGFLSLAAQGYVSCGSVMVPCPWFCEIAEAAAADPALDLGVHLTLTSEWAGYCRAPISTVSRACGLIDDDGYFWRDVASLGARLIPEAAEIELRAQIARARSAGMNPTHIDAHMAAAMLPELLDLHIGSARNTGSCRSCRARSGSHPNRKPMRRLWLCSSVRAGRSSTASEAPCR